MTRARCYGSLALLVLGFIGCNYAWPLLLSLLGTAWYWPAILALFLSGLALWRLADLLEARHVQ